MGLNDSIGKKWQRTELMEQLVTELSFMAVQARLIDFKGPEAIRRSRFVMSNHIGVI